jgi:hypothetical protein
MIQNGVSPIGKVKTHSKRLLVFPNTHVHRLEGLTNITSRKEIRKYLSSSPKSKMRTVVFHLINPERWLTSTHEVPMQQDYCGGKLTRLEALEYQLNLMAERAHKKSDWNVRRIHLRLSLDET